MSKSKAVAVRRDLGLFQNEDQNACRLVHAEGDGLLVSLPTCTTRSLWSSAHSMHRALPILSAHTRGLGRAIGGHLQRVPKR